MKEPYIESLANYNDPESCGCSRETSAEALTGAHSGGVLSRENSINSGADVVVLSGKQHIQMRYGECLDDPTRSETSSTSGNSMRENREVPCFPFVYGTKGRFGKAGSHNPEMYEHGKSDSLIVSTKSPNKVAEAVAEAVERRGLTKENTQQSDTAQTQGWTKAVPSGLERVREAAERSKDEKFSALLHHVTLELLSEAYYELKKYASPGVDRVTWHMYQADLEENLQDLHGRLHRGTYRAKPSRRAYIPKPDGQERPLGIAALEDKIAQRAVVKVLNAIYEMDFLGFSYGFRPGKSAHVALDALAVGIRFKKINWILDADIRSYFDTIDHNWMMKFLKHRISDKRILRLIWKWLKAGVIEDKQWRASEGAPQGSSISPLLANIYLHYTLDQWVQWWREQEANGDVIIVRWADDFVVGFQHKFEAERFKSELQKRFNQFSLSLHPEKTRLIRFGRFARRDAKQIDNKSKPETFKFLGFTHYCGINRNGKFKIVRVTIRERLTAKLKQIKKALRAGMHESIQVQGRWIAMVMKGYFNYHAIPGNRDALETFRTEVTKMWYKTLLRRSQRRRINWKQMGKIVKKWLPTVKKLHPWPEERFAAIIQGRSPVR